MYIRRLICVLKPFVLSCHHHRAKRLVERLQGKVYLRVSSLSRSLVLFQPLHCGTRRVWRGCVRVHEHLVSSFCKYKKAAICFT